MHAPTCFRVSVAAALLLSAFLGGAWLESSDIGPMPALRAIKRVVLPPSEPAAGAAAVDGFDRLVFFPGKVETACPRHSTGTEVLLLVGQSNAANHAGQRHDSAFGERIVNYFDGKCYRASSPLLGASGTQGESWVLLANKMIAAGLAENVVIVPAAIGASAIDRWAEGGDLNPMIAGVADRLRRDGLRVTRVVWHQGERDFLLGRTDGDAYRRRFGSVVATLRERGVESPIYVSVATAGESYPGWRRDNPIATAQRSLPDRRQGIFAGVDTDSLVSFRDRYDGTHFSASGQEKFTDALIAIFKAER